ncbi:unnamed protein product [Phytophthora fragariaefolia]|uniref:Unnamed protein product n=1 Tax=Phytophthora fragariaefolia TaxID=1490495 RepID=A0A9W6XYD7_9STRA|nr:unnamed protein product [Phytophthora fragariaefolia]
MLGACRWWQRTSSVVSRASSLPNGPPTAHPKVKSSIAMQRPRNLVLPTDLSRHKDELEANLIVDSDTSDCSSPRKPSSSSKKTPTSIRHRFLSTTKRRTLFWSTVLVGLAIGVCVLLAVEMRVLPRSVLLLKQCSPRVLSVQNIEYHSSHRFNTMIKNIDAFPVPSFRSKHEALCEDSDRQERGYQYCLPISGRKDSEFCSGADRMDLLVPQSSSTRCYASVLHLLLVDVYEELKALNYSPILAWGSLLGAVRNGSMIPFTEDTDIAYVGEISVGSELDEALWQKGYHLFHQNIWRVCVAPTHPLAGNLFDPERSIAQDYSVPYLDLYSMEKVREGKAFEMQEWGGTLPAYRVEPYSEVVINGLPYDTVHDPDYFLLEEYGPDYKKPKPRRLRL